MSKSMFKNFDPENLGTVYYDAEKKLKSLGLTVLMYEALCCCCEKKHTKFSASLINFAYNRSPITNDNLSVLARNIEALTQSGFEDSEADIFSPFDEKKDKERPSNKLSAAIHGRRLNSNSHVTESQIRGFFALQELDSALSEAFDKGLTPKVCDSFMLVARNLERAKATLKPSTLESIETAVQQAQSQRARDSANIRHTKGVKAIAKAFVHSCWKDWQAKPEQYKSKAKFALSMLGKCEDLTSQKSIEDWCREWEKARTKTVALLAH